MTLRVEAPPCLHSPRFNLMTLRAEHVGNDEGDAGFVFDQKNARAHLMVPAVAGNRTIKVAPCPGLLVTETSPW